MLVVVVVAVVLDVDDDASDVNDDVIVVVIIVYVFLLLLLKKMMVVKSIARRCNPLTLQPIDTHIKPRHYNPFGFVFNWLPVKNVPNTLFRFSRVSVYSLI